MKYFSFLLILTATMSVTFCFAQDFGEQPDYHYAPCSKSTPGCYDSFKNFKAGVPVLSLGFEMEKRIKRENNDSRAGGYNVIFDGGKKNSGISLDHIWGVYYNDSLYLNRKFYTGKKGFDKVYCLGNTGYFHSINPSSGAEADNAALNSGMLFGLVGGAIAGAIADGNNNVYGKYPNVMIYLIDLKSGMVSPLNRFKLEKILESDPQLSESYAKEKYKSSMMVMHAYIDTFAERNKNK